jgi:hypothetical protein
VQLTPPEAVRTGGDPVPWGRSAETTPYDYGDRDYGDRDAYEQADAEPRRRRPERPPDRPPSISVEPDDEPGTPWLTETSTPGYRYPEHERPDVRPSDEPPEPPRRMRTAVEAPDQPWLTRTTTSPVPPGTNGSLDDHVAQGDGTEGPRSAPRSDEPRRGSSRMDEILGNGEARPWIALPIEPDDEDPLDR